MSIFINYEQILADFKAGVEAANLGFVKVFQDVEAREISYDALPLLDIRLKHVDPEALTNQTYYASIVIECEIIVHNLSARRLAAKLRNELVDKLQRYVKDNPRFSTFLETTFIGTVDLQIAENKQDGAFVASAVCEFYPKIYIN